MITAISEEKATGDYSLPTGQAMAVQPNFTVNLLAHFASQLTADWLRDHGGEITAPMSAITGVEDYHFVSEEALSPHDLAGRLRSLVEEPQPRTVVVLSDRLVRSRRHTDGVPEGPGLVPTRLVSDIRKCFSSPAAAAVCGLLAIARNSDLQIRDIDAIVGPADDLRIHSVRAALRGIVDGLRLKAPPPTNTQLDPADAVLCRVVESREELRACLKLRWKVYSQLRYLDPATRQSDEHLDMDQYDPSSIQFVAIEARSGRVIGTMRLVMSWVDEFIKNSIVGRPAHLFAKHRQWCEEIKSQLADQAMKGRVDQPRTAELPILQSPGFRDQWIELAEQAEHGVEVSRLVVSPEARGLGVSKMLVRMGIAAAYELQKDHLLLECAPNHVGMYAHYGFQRMPQPHFRHQELDVTAYGMRLILESDMGVLDPVVSQAQRDIETARELSQERRLHLNTSLDSDHICLCANTLCWKDSSYSDRGTSSCPLRDLHSSPDHVNAGIR